MILIFLIFLGGVLYVSYQNKDKTIDEPNKTAEESGEEQRTDGENYKKRLNLYKNAIEQNRYHSIRKLERDYHVPAYTVYLDIKKLQEEGYFHNVKLDYDKDAIIYLDELKQVDTKSVNTKQVKTKPANTRQKLNGESKNVAIHMEEKVQQENTIPFYTKESIQAETTPEYRADYGNGEVEYNYVAEYPDTSHIWDDLNKELFPNTHDMKLCPSCGTENIIVRDSSGKCHCFYCQEELS